jgi:hypothetical protein
VKARQPPGAQQVAAELQGRGQPEVVERALRPDQVDAAVGQPQGRALVAQPAHVGHLRLEAPAQALPVPLGTQPLDVGRVQVDGHDVRRRQQRR